MPIQYKDLGIGVKLDFEIFCNKEFGMKLKYQKLVRLLKTLIANLLLLVISPVVVLVLISSCMNRPAGLGTADSSTGGSKVSFTFDGATSATNLSDTQIQIQWTGVTHAELATYRVYVLNADGSLSSVATVANSFSSYVVSNLSPGTLYSYVVRAANIDGLTDLNNNFVSAMTYAGVSGSSVLSSTSASLSFPSAPAATNLKIYCATGGTESYTLMASIPSSSSTYSLTGLTAGTQYKCKIKALASSGTEDANSLTTSFTPSSTPGVDLTFGGLASATVLSAGNQIQLLWTLGTGANIQSYRISEVASDGVTLSTITTVSNTTSSYTLTGVSSLSFHTYVVHALSSTNVTDGNSVHKKVFTYTGPSSSSSVSTSSVTINFPAVGGNAEGVYIFCKTTSQGSYSTTPQLVINSTTATSTSLSGLTTGTTYQCKVSPYLNSVYYDNSGATSFSTHYAGVTSSTVTGTTTATIYFPAVGTIDSATAAYIYCRTLSGSYPSTPTLIVSSSTASSGGLTGLASGRTYTCKVAPYVSGAVVDNSSTTTVFQTTSLSSTNYNGVILVQAFGDASSAPSPQPTAKQVVINWKHFGSSSVTSQSYWVVRTGLGETLDMTTTTACTNVLTSSCRVCTITGMGPQSCTDTAVAASPQKYDYAITKVSSDNVAEELPTGADTNYRISVPIPPSGMALVHRDSVNFEMCSLIGQTPDPLNHQRCAYTGLGNVPYNTGSSLNTNPLGLSNSYYDFGYNLFVDRWEAACNWGTTGGATPTGGINGDVYFKNSSGECYINANGTWRTTDDEALTEAQRILALTIVPSTTYHKPPMTATTQFRAYSTCNAIVDSTYGAKRLMRKREFVAMAAWPTTTGEYGYVSDANAVVIENGGDHSFAPATYRCNTDTHNGISNDAFNGVGYELSRDTASGPDSFTIGSSGTKNCISRFGIQDLIGNVWEWTSDQMNTCSSSTHTCSGATSTLDTGNDWMNSISFNGTQGHGGGSSNLTDWLFETASQTIGSVLYSTNYFSPALGFPLVSNDSGNALLVGTAISSTKLHGDRFTLNTDNSNGTPARALAVGGAWNTGTGAGRWTTSFSYNPSSYIASSIGFRCVLPAE